MSSSVRSTKMQQVGAVFVCASVGLETAVAMHQRVLTPGNRRVVLTRPGPVTQINTAQIISTHIDNYFDKEGSKLEGLKTSGFFYETRKNHDNRDLRYELYNCSFGFDNGACKDFGIVLSDLGKFEKIPERGNNVEATIQQAAGKTDSWLQRYLFPNKTNGHWHGTGPVFNFDRRDFPSHFHVVKQIGENEPGDEKGGLSYGGQVASIQRGGDGYPLPITPTDWLNSATKPSKTPYMGSWLLVNLSQNADVIKETQGEQAPKFVFYVYVHEGYSNR